MLLCYFRQTRAGWSCSSMSCVQRFHSEEILSEGAEILSGTPNAPTVARFRLVTSSVPPGSGVLLLCRVCPTTHRALPVEELFPLRVCRRICLPLPGVSYRDILVRREEETQGGDVSTMRIWVYCASPRYVIVMPSSGEPSGVGSISQFC